MISRCWRGAAFFAAALSFALFAGEVLAAAPAASAKPVWSIASFPSPSASAVSSLESVSCPGASTCFAVGFVQIGKANTSLVERWNGSKWSVMTSPNPAGSTNVHLLGVSCPSITSCFAVGNYSMGSSLNSLVMRWDGSAWSIVASPNPAGSTNVHLLGVSCAAATSCFAVGSYSAGGSVKSLVERWDGTAWTIMSVPGREGSNKAVLNAVSCPTASSCFAVGFDHEPDIVQHTLVEHWDGIAWSIMKSPNPDGSIGTGLAGVSCASAKSCFAVGFYAHPFNRSVVERWNGTSWTIVPSPLLNASDF